MCLFAQASVQLSKPKVTSLRQILSIFKRNPYCFIAQAPGTSAIKHFTAVINSKVFVAVSHKHPSLIFVEPTGVDHLTGHDFNDILLALPANNRLGWK